MDRIQFRRDTLANWNRVNPILLEGEMGIVMDNPNQYKIGDGIHTWNDLPLRGYTGTIAQDKGYDENTVMSQKVTTEKLTELEREGIYDISAHNGGAIFESFSTLLNDANLSTLIPTSVRCGGMSIRFVQGSVPNFDNKYVQYRLMAEEFTTDVTQWQGVDDEPTAGSNNLVKSGGDFLFIKNNISQTEKGLYGCEIKKPYLKLGYYNLNTCLFNEGNYHCIWDVHLLKGLHLSADKAGSVTQYAFFVDYDTEKCVLAGEKHLTSFGSNVEVPAEANYLYMYLGNNFSSAEIPNLSIDEGMATGAIVDKIHYVEDGVSNLVHGTISLANKSWTFWNQDQEKYNHIIVPVSAGDRVEIEKGSNPIFAAFFRDYYLPPKPYTYDSNHKAVITAKNLFSELPNSIISEVSSYSGVAPDDAKYIYFLVNYATTTNPYLPSVLKINGREVSFGVYGNKRITNMEGRIEKVEKTYPFSNISIFETLKEIYIEGDGVDLSSVANIRLTVGYYTSGNYYNVFSLIDSNNTNLVIYSKPYTSLEKALTSLSNGVWVIDTFSTNTLGVDKIILAGDFVSYATQNNYFSGTFNNKCNNLLLCPIINSYLGSSNKNVGLQKVSSTNFNLLKQMNGKTLVYHWDYNHWQSTSGNKVVIDEDCWSNSSIYELSSPNTQIAQCNINFIHMFSDTTLHTGNGHGCCVDKVFKIFVDGNLVDFGNMANGDVISGNDIYIIQQSDGYHPSSARTIEFGGDGNKVYAEVDVNNQPVLAVRWCLDYHFTANGEDYINKLFILKDNISFKRCYGAMNCIFPAADSNNVSINDKDATLNHYVRENNAWTVSVVNGVNLNNGSGEYLEGATKVVQYGDTFRVETECVNDLHPTFGRIIPWFAGTDAGGRVKIYLTPINTTEAPSGITPDVFNSGDVISCHVKRNVSIY